MKSRATSSLLAFAGLAATISAPAAAAGNGTPRGDLVPLTKAGVLYINLSTGERSISLYNLAEPEPIDTHATAALFDYWISMDENPCWDDHQADGFGWNLESTCDAASCTSEPNVGWDYGDLPFDSKITGVMLSTATLVLEDTDSNGDGILDTGMDTVVAFYDGLSESHRSSNTPPTAVVRIESIPGQVNPMPTEPADFQSYDLVLDFGGEWFELGDSDGQNLGDLWLPDAAPGLDVTESSDGLADFQYLQYYALHGGNAKVTQDSSFILLGTPQGEILYTTHTTTTFTDCTTTPACTGITITMTVTETYLLPDAFPQAQGAMESFGFGTLGLGGDTTNIDSSIGGCCFWFGGVDCVGFLDQLEVDPPQNVTWYQFGPYAQNALGLFSSAPHQNSCTALDLNADGILDNADIGAFIALFLAQDPLADLNADGIVDNGDIGAFVSLFLACSN